MKLLEHLQAVIGLLVVVVAVVLGARRASGRARPSRPATTSNVFEVMDEVFSPARHSAALELRTQRQQGPVIPVPDDLLPPSHEGRYVVKRKDAPAPTDLRLGTSDTSAPAGDSGGCGTACLAPIPEPSS